MAEPAESVEPVEPIDLQKHIVEVLQRSPRPLTVKFILFELAKQNINVDTSSVNKILYRCA